MAVSADQEHSMLHRKPRILVVGSFVMDVIATTEQIMNRFLVKSRKWEGLEYCLHALELGLEF